MKIHEYQAKKLLGDYGAPVPSGIVAETAEAARQAAEKMLPCVIKAQVHSGGRPATPAQDFGWTKLKVYNICKPPVRQNRGRIVYYNQKSMASPFRVRVFSAPRVRT